MKRRKWIWRGVSIELEPAKESAPSEFGATDEHLARKERLLILEEEVAALRERIVALESGIMTQVETLVLSKRVL